MAKKCPPGVICIENMSMMFIIILILIIAYLVYAFVGANTKPVNVNNSPNIMIKETTQERNSQSGSDGYGWGSGLFGFFTRPNYGYTNLPGDVLMNPYVPPLRDERYLVPELAMAPPGRVPINVSTNIGAVDTNYRQVGLLTPLNASPDGKILALMGRPLFTNREKWQYYTISDQNNSIKLPVIVKGRSASNEYGVDKIYSGDTIYVEGYKQAFRVTEYENDTIRYLPYV
jgi:hypothetical protein